MFLLCLARLVIALVPFRLWRGRFGLAGNLSGPESLREARLLAAHVSRAAGRLPFDVKCLPQAMVLGWQLERRRIACRMVFAVRPPDQRQNDDALHAWIECGEQIVLGELPGPWLEVYKLPPNPPAKRPASS